VGKSHVADETNYNRIISVYFNVTNPLISDKAVRQALSYAIPYRTDLERAYSPISKISWAYSDNIKSIPMTCLQPKICSATPKKDQRLPSHHFYLFPYFRMLSPIAASWTTLGLPTDVRVVNSVPADYQCS